MEDEASPSLHPPPGPVCDVMCPGLQYPTTECDPSSHRDLKNEERGGPAIL